MTPTNRATFEPVIAKGTEVEWKKLVELLRSCDLPSAGLKEHLATTIVACAEGAIVAVAAIEIHMERVGILRSVAASPQSRGLGLGKLLTEKAIDLARDSGLRELFLLTNTAERFFERYGFKIVTRDSAPAVLQFSTEFTLDCCRSATVMRLVIPGASASCCAGA